jgi:hypothetical protein
MPSNDVSADALRKVLRYAAEQVRDETDADAVLASLQSSSQRTPSRVVLGVAAAAVLVVALLIGVSTWSANRDDPEEVTMGDDETSAEATFDATTCSHDTRSAIEHVRASISGLRAPAATTQAGLAVASATIGLRTDSGDVAVTGSVTNAYLTELDSGNRAGGDQLTYTLAARTYTMTNGDVTELEVGVDVSNLEPGTYDLHVEFGITDVDGARIDVSSPCTVRIVGPVSSPGR